MLVYDKEYCQTHTQELLRAFIRRSVFIYPTDTIYGIGCDATSRDAVARIRDIKQRSAQPFSVIAPSKEWIERNCIVPEPMRAWLDKLPGPYTLLLPYRGGNAVADNVAPGQSLLGVRIPAHWFSRIVESFGHPIVTTSVNRTGEPHMVSLTSADRMILEAADFIIDDGEKSGRPSTLVMWDGSKVVIQQR